MIATHRSSGNECFSCTSARHGRRPAPAGVSMQVGRRSWPMRYRPAASEKRPSAGHRWRKCARDGRLVTAEDIGIARPGADDKAIHDTVLIAAMFCTTATVDGLATWTPKDPALYDDGTRTWPPDGYVRS